MKQKTTTKLFDFHRNGNTNYDLKFSTVILGITLFVLLGLLSLTLFSKFPYVGVKIVFYEDVTITKRSVQNISQLPYILKEHYGINVTRVRDDATVKYTLSSNATCANVPNNLKFDCHPDAPINEEKCLSRGCCWEVVEVSTSSSNLPPSPSLPPLNVPYCYYPSNFLGYKVVDIKKSKRQIYARLQRIIPSGFPKDIQNVKVMVYFQDKYTARIKLTDLKRQRYEGVLPIEKSHHEYSGDTFGSQRLYDIQLHMNGNLTIIRSLNKEIIFHTNLSTLVFSDQFLQLSSGLPSHFIYGLGQHKAPLLRSVNWQRFTLFNRDQEPVENMNLYGSHPFYLALEKGGNSHGVFLLNTNAMDVILQPTPAVTFRPIGGILDFFIFLGPSPTSVIQQYTKLIGTTFMPPYWSLGFHLCRFGYNTLNNTEAVWNRTRMAEIPFDTQWNDIDYMTSHNDFTYDKKRFKGLPGFVKELHSVGMHYIPIIDPGISNTEPTGTYPPFDDGMQMDIFVKNSSGNLFIGKVWNKVSTVFPDFTHPNATAYWTKQFRRYHSEVEFDGAWIDMNEPSNFYNGQIDGCPNSTLENPQYVPGTDPLRTKTLCMTCKHYRTIHYNIHNVYGLSEAVTTNRALTTIRNKRPFIISRSSFPSLGHFAGNWDGDVTSSWDNMRWTIPSILSFNMFGIPMTGADICGFNGNTTIELCARWSALGAFYPFSRNHNTDDSIAQDPVSLGPIVTAAAKKSLTTRYFLLPYLYTLFYKSHLFGDPVARPLFFEYPMDTNTYAVDRQFLWGSALMILPALDLGVTKIICYLPNDIWYDFYTGRQYPNTGINITLSAPIDKINLALRGGYILPAQKPAVTTTQSRLNDFAIIVALDKLKSALGELYWDDGDSLGSLSHSYYTLVQFHAQNQILQTFPIRKNYTILPPLGSVTMFGCNFEPKSVVVNNVSVTFKYDLPNKVLLIPQLKLSLLNKNVIKWK